MALIRPHQVSDEDGVIFVDLNVLVVVRVPVISEANVVDNVHVLTLAVQVE